MRRPDFFIRLCAKGFEQLGLGEETHVFPAYRAVRANQNIGRIRAHAESVGNFESGGKIRYMLGVDAVAKQQAYRNGVTKRRYDTRVG